MEKNPPSSRTNTIKALIAFDDQSRRLFRFPDPLSENVGALQMRVQRGSRNVLLLKVCVPTRRTKQCRECIIFCFFKKQGRDVLSDVPSCCCFVSARFLQSSRASCVYLAPPTPLSLSLRSLKIVNCSQINALSLKAPRDVKLRNRGKKKNLRLLREADKIKKSFKASTEEQVSRRLVSEWLFI